MDPFALARPFAYQMAILGLCMALVAPLPYVLGIGEPIWSLLVGLLLVLPVMFMRKNQADNAIEGSINGGKGKRGSINEDDGDMKQ